MKLIKVGTIRKPHGLRGAFLVVTQSDRSSSLKHLSKIQIELQPNQLHTFSIEEAAWMPRGWKIKVDSINSIEEASTLQGKEIYAPRDWLPQTAPNEFYVSDLIGLSIIKNNNRIGELVEVETLPHGPEVWWYFDGNETTGIPAHTRFIEKICLDEKKIYLK